jgi:hypothetical protein
VVLIAVVAGIVTSPNTAAPRGSAAPDVEARLPWPGRRDTLTAAPSTNLLPTAATGCHQTHTGGAVCPRPPTTRPPLERDSAALAEATHVALHAAFGELEL